MNNEWSEIAANDVIHAAQMAMVNWSDAAWQHMRPSVLYRPTISLDGNCYCALYGDDLMAGCAGFGETMADAMTDFDKNWMQQKAPRAAITKATPEDRS